MAEAIGLAASIVGLATVALKLADASYEYVRKVKNAEKDIKQLVEELKSLANLLEPFKDSDEAYKVADPPRPDLSPGLAEYLLTDCKKLLDQLDPKLPKKPESSSSKIFGKLGMQKKRLGWPFNEHDTREVIDRIERFKASLGLKLQMDRDRQKTLESILNWISSDRFGQRHADITGKRAPGVGDWLLEAPQFVNWKAETAGSVLLGRGIGSARLKAGAGKTYLSSLVIDHLIKERSEKNYGVAHIYFQYQEQNQQTSFVIMASILKQLLSQIPSIRFPQNVQEIYKKKSSQHPTLDDVMWILSSISDQFTHVFVICDALDEMDQATQRENILPLFHTIENSGISLFLTTRPHPADVLESFSEASIIELVPNKNEMRLYVEERLSKNGRFQKVIQKVANKNLQQRAVTTIVDASAEVFLMARFNVEYICSFGTLSTLEQSLKKLSAPITAGANASWEHENEQRMDDTYDRIMSPIRIHPARKYGFRAISWIAYATKTLRVDELLVAISIEDGHCGLSDGDIYSLGDLLDLCNGLIVTDERNEYVRLVHFSARNYLDRRYSGRSDSETVISSKITRDIYYAKTCLTYLSFDIFKERQGGIHGEAEMEDTSLFTTYAVHNLQLHLSRIDNRFEEDTTDAILRFLSDGECRQFFADRRLHIYSYLAPGCLQTEFIPRLQVACALGYEGAVKWLLTEPKVDVNSQFPGDPGRTTPLSWAVEYNHPTVVQLLVENGADIGLEYTVCFLE